MSDDDNWLPPRARAAAGTLTDETPDTHQPPVLFDVPPDDPAVVALVSPLADPAAPLPPSPGVADIIGGIAVDEETPPPFDPGDPDVRARKERCRPIANAELLRAFVDQHADEDDIPSLRLRVLKLEQDLRNLSDFVRDDYKRRTNAR